MILESLDSVALPRGYVGPVTDEEREYQMRIAALEQQQSQAWSEGVGKATADVSARHADLRIDLESEAAKAMFRQVALSMCHNGGEFDRGTHPYFEQERSIAQALQTLRGEVNQIIDRRIGPPEFEGMQQLADFDRPQTRTDLFKAWFGKSAVVDNAGRPLIVFHGTNRDLSQFDTRTMVEEGGGRRNQNWLGVLGSWFAAPSDSASYEVGNAEATADVFSERRDNAEGAVIYPVFLSVQKAYEFEDYEELVDECDESGGIAALRVKLVQAGYDGIVVRECSTDGGQYRSDWVAFYPTQIKSALSNVGTFDPQNPDIRWSVVPDTPTSEESTQAMVKALVGNQATQQPRAKAGGEYGANGEWYAGGAFIATTDLPKKTRRWLSKNAKSSLVQIDYFEATGPKKAEPRIGEFPILGIVGGTVLQGPSGPLNEVYLDYLATSMNADDGYIGRLRELAQKFIAGERWVKVVDYPGFSGVDDLVRMVLAGEPIPGAALKKFPDHVQENFRKVIAAQADLSVQEVPVANVKKPSSMPPGKLPSSEMKSRVLDLTWGTKGIKRLDTPGMLAAVVNRTGRPVFVVDGNLGRNEFKAALVEAEQAGLEFDKIHVFADSATYSGRSIDFMRLDSVMPRGVLASTEEAASVVPQDVGTPVAVDESPAEKDNYRRDHTAPTREYGAPLSDLTENGIYPDSAYGANGRRDLGNDVDAFTLNTIARLKGKPDSLVTVYRAVPKGLKAEIKAGDWVTINQEYANYHGRKFLKDSFDVIEKAVRASEIFTDGNSIHEWGYEPGGELAQAVLPDVIPVAAADSEAFSAWFGNSKVVDAQGSPLVVYHGTDKDFTAFNTERGSRPTFFSSHEELARSYAGERAKRSGTHQTLYPVYLQISNPMIVDANGALWDSIATGGIENNNKAILDLEKRGVKNITTSRAAEIAEKYGFDGVVIKNVLDAYGYNRDAPKSTVYAVFNSTQIKSATEHNGDFNGTNPDIRFSVADSKPAEALEDRPAFKEWFGGSKVVDDDAKPLVVYHGTNEDFTEFSAELMGEGNGNSDWGDGFYFASNRDAASGYGDNVMPVYLDIKNPADAKVMLSKEVQDSMQDAMGGDATQDVLESMGYDGIIIDHGKDGKEYVVFKPSQIKSATLNNGRFDPTNPDIRFSVVDFESDVPIDPTGPALLDVEKSWEAKGIETTLYEKNGIITLSKIVVPKASRNQGIGSAAMRELLAYADKTNQQIALTPANDFGGNKARLNTFYRSFGFRTYKGFKVREKLIRDPEPVAPSIGAMFNGTKVASEYDTQRAEGSNNDLTGAATFKTWFGDSRVVDGNGGPLVLYHGTDANFTAFDTRSWEGGAFFTTNRTGAQQYGSKVMSVYLSIENPLEVSPYDWHAGRLPDDEVAKADGYDGYVIRNHDIGVDDGQPFVGDTYVAFSPTQVKSAETHDVAFNTTNQDIRFSVVEDTQGGSSVSDAALVSGSNAAIATLNRVMRSAGWEVEYIDMDVTAEKPKVDIRVNRDDGRFLIAKVDSVGRASFETFQRERSLRMDGSTKGRRPLSPMVDDTFLGRQKFEGARSMLRGLTNYLADNATATIALSDLRSAWAGVMSEPIKQDAAPAVSLSDAIASNAVAFHEDTRLSVVADAELVDASGVLVDDAGNPLTVYHGTTSDFTEFQTGEHGIFFTSSLRSAEAYAIGYDHQEINESGGRVHAAHLSLVNPAYIDGAYLEKIALANPDLIAKESLEASSNLSLQEAFEDSESWARDIVVDLVRSNGHDGMVIVNDLLPVEHLGGDWDYCTTYVVFSADQVRPIATPAREHRLQESETADVHHSIKGEPNIQFSVVNDVGNPVEPLEPLAFHEDIPNEQWLANKVADVVEDGRNQWGVPRYMGPVTGRFSRSLNLPVSSLATVPGERGEQDAIRQESLDYIHANWDTLIASQTPYIEVDPFGKAWVNEGNHRIMVAAERGLTHLPVDVRYFSGGQRQTADFAPERLVQLDAQYTNSQLQQSCAEAAPEELEGEALARVWRLPGLRNSAGASYTFWKLASAALRAVDGDASSVDWHAVEAATIQESVCANGQSHSSVCEALCRYSPGAVSEDRQKAILGLAQAVSEQHARQTQEKPPGIAGFSFPT